jgi:hypothetical protein
VRLERAQPGEVKVRAIKLVAHIDSTDVQRAALQADTVAERLKNGVPFDTLARHYHDYPGKEETTLLTPFERAKLPPTYQAAFDGKQSQEIVKFTLPTSNPAVPKFVVAQLQTVDPGGQMTLGELRIRIRQNLSDVGSVRRYLDSVRKTTFVTVHPELMTPKP